MNADILILVVPLVLLALFLWTERPSKRRVLESRFEHRLRVVEPTGEDWTRLADAIAREDARRLRVAEVVDISAYRAYRRGLDGAA